MDKLLISVIIPCYNIAPYVGKCLDSVLAQTYQNLEIICVNDGSKDETGTVLDEYASKDKRIKVIHQENGGVTKARFTGLNVAQGEWIGFIDGDDMIDVDMYERLYNNATDEIDISHCGYKKRLKNGTIVYVYNTGKKIYQDTRSGYKDLIEATFMEPSLCNKLFRRHLFDGLQDWLDVSIKINEDMLMNFYLFRKSRQSVYEDFCPYSYLYRKGCASCAVNARMLLDPIKVLDILNHGLADDKELQELVKNRLAYYLIDSASVSCYHKKEVKEARKVIRKRLRKSLKEILREKHYSKRYKICALWVCIWPASYRWVHKQYRKRHSKNQTCQKEWA
ncbi:MAG: glycosyltransferase [Clostridia bacterium]|nr:glycosyltransferase [Clostridia bacterium]